MALNYKTPGVYLEEIPTLPSSVAQVETSIPAFIGYTQKAAKKGESLDKTPIRIDSFLEYELFFGAPSPEKNIKINVKEINENDSIKYEVHAADIGLNIHFLMYYQVKMYFDNGGGACYIISVGDYASSIDSDDLEEGLQLLEKEDEPTLILFPDAQGLGSSKEFYELYKKALSQCGHLKDRFVIIDTYHNSTKDFRKNISSDDGKYGAVYHPFVKTTLKYHYRDEDISVAIDPANEEADLKKPKSKSSEPSKNKLEAIKKTNNGLYLEIIKTINSMGITLPPSGALAGIYARVDSTRGVWKAPANVVLQNVFSPTIKISDSDQELLNVDASTGISINAIRSFSNGIRVWGARTLAGNDNEWRYVNVRRFFNMVEESIKKATNLVVFEPNDANTWVKTKAMIENYLSKLWRDGALMGATPQQAFFVNVGLGRTMTPEDINEGRMNIEIGLAAQRPAEFIILKFSHKLPEMA